MQSQTSFRSAAALGLADVAPILIGVVPFGLIYGIVAMSVGLPELPAFLMSSLVFAGASQIAGVELLDAGAPLWVVVGTAWIINLRMSMYSAALAPHFRTESLPWRGLLSYLITDQGFAVSMVRFDTLEPRRRKAYYVGASLGLWTTWQVSSAAGVFLGAGVPASWSLDFAIPLTFLALIFPAIKGRPTAAAALTAGVASLATHDVPMHLGLMISALVGIAVGFLLDRETT